MHQKLCIYTCFQYNNREHWDRLRALSGDPSIPLYIAFPEENKLQLVLSLINGKLAERKNILKLYK